MKIAAIVFFLVAAMLFYFYYPIARAIRTSKTIEEKTTRYEQHPDTPPMRILVLGDSTAYGTGASIARYSTAGRLGETVPSADIVNLSENGLKLAGLVSTLPTIEDTQFDLVLIQIGANDVTRFTSLSNIRKEVATIMMWADTHAARTIVLTAGDIGISPVFRKPLSYFITKQTRAVREIFKEEVSKHSTATYVDLFTEDINSKFRDHPEVYYAQDLFHPSDAGYALWFKEIQSHVTF